MSLIIFDTYRRRKVAFQSLNPGLVKLYTCGPTVYAPAHIGNFRTYVFEDLLRRTLKYLGFEVLQVMNLTDIDDKTIRAARQRGIPLQEVTEPIIAQFFKDLDILKIERAELYPRATAHIPEMIDLILKLLDRGYAYSADNSIYFRISQFPEYGALSGMKLDSLARGVRIVADEYEKDDFRDFALWKGWTPDDGEVVWEAPFGRGRPGWHIECSAMSMKYLGEEFDIHTGGVDNIFPHHENELAQSRCATGRGFARYWMHSAHLMWGGEKMSKSLGNLFTLDELLAKGFSPRAIRYALISTHYRQQLFFNEDAVKAAGAALDRLDTLYQAALTAEGVGSIRSEIIQVIMEAQNSFKDSLEDDLGIAGALAALFDLVSAIHRLVGVKPLNRAEGEALLNVWRDFDRALGVLIPVSVNIPEAFVKLAQERLEARKSRDFQRADEIRRLLMQEGYQIEDGKEGMTLIGKEGRIVVKY